VSRPLLLRVRTPDGLLVDRPVRAVSAEDLDGWFGLAPGRRSMVAALPPGLLVFRDGDGEWFVAHAGGLLDLVGDECRVMTLEAELSDDLERVAGLVEARRASRRTRGQRHRDALHDLAREALRRLAREARA
jgi:alternate F1F0 ATPase F1 subunit epsilon